MTYCSKCGMENEETHKFCSNCGKELIKMENSGEVPEPFQEPTKLMIDVNFYESMPGRGSLNNNKSYIRGIMEIADNEIIIHKKSFWRGKDRGKKHIRYDKITSIDFDKGKMFSMPAIQVYLSSVEYSFRSHDKRLNSFYDVIREKINELESQENAIAAVSPMEELKKLAELRDMGIVTDEEFELKKKQILGL